MFCSSNLDSISCLSWRSNATGHLLPYNIKSALKIQGLLILLQQRQLLMVEFKQKICVFQAQAHVHPLPVHLKPQTPHTVEPHLQPHVNDNLTIRLNTQKAHLFEADPFQGFDRRVTPPALGVTSVTRQPQKPYTITCLTISAGQYTRPHNQKTQTALSRTAVRNPTPPVLSTHTSASFVSSAESSSLLQFPTAGTETQPETRELREVCVVNAVVAVEVAGHCTQSQPVFCKIGQVFE